MRSNKTLVAIFLLLTAGATTWFSLRGRAQDEQPAKSAVIDASKYASLQKALDAAPEGGIVQLPPGRFELTKPLVLSRGDTRLQGAGAATHLVNKNEEGQPALILSPTGYSDKKRRVRIWRVQVADLRISGNPKSGDGILAQGVNEIFLHGVSIDHNGGHGINLVDCYEDPRISDSILTYNKKAGLNILRGHDIVVNANQFEENQDALRCIDSFNLCMNGNNIDDHLRHGIVIENTYGSVVSGNMIEECKGTAIILDRDCYGNTVSANVIAHNFGGGVDLKDAWGCTVSANTFTIVRVQAITVDANAGRITVTGNSFCNSHVGGKIRRTKTDDPATGVLLQSTSDIALTGNTFTGLSNHAIKTEGECKRILVVGNVISEIHLRAPQQLPAIDLRGAKQTEVTANVFDTK